ncbi:T9SS type A sorting domain-containing protein [Spirosoma foliorum]|uniref:T9SS type A sorting domain-containing protein n=1 Tax=Spirosoma foliorum TaxID=2710596 RepID=A0A7G5GQ43_9BACT|nr:T9SS type A sorting domain-containing protein [Spirosoma foliorum]QMW00985.1 T9SS type A sorting domain-containing protein [Spirosoma foliorum]
MRNLFSYLLLSGFGCLSIAQAQTLTPQTIASAGGFLQQGNNSLSFTIGQSVATALSTGSGSVSQGFQQAAAARIITALEPVPSLLVRVFPNPTRQYLYIDCPPARLTLIDILGRPCWQGRSDGKPLQVDVQTFATGVYLLQVLTEDTVQTIRLVLQP